MQQQLLRYKVKKKLRRVLLEQERFNASVLKPIFPVHELPSV
jgi:hypothetical protein